MIPTIQTGALSLVVDLRTNAVSIDGRGVVLGSKGLPGWTGGGVEVRRAKTERLWGHGDFTESGTRGARLVSIEGFAWDSTRAGAAALTDELSATLADGTPGLLTVIDPDLGTRTAVCVLTGTPDVQWDGNLDLTFGIDIECPDPRKYGATVAASTGVATAGGALEYPLDDPLDYGAGGNPGTLTLANVGTADTSVKHTLTGVAPSGFTITHRQSGSRLIYSAPLIAGQSLVLDSDDGAVMLDGYANRSTSLTRREWVRLNGGESGTWLLESVGSTGLQLTTEVRPAWW